MIPCIISVTKAGMEHTLWELIVFLVLTPLALTSGALLWIDHFFRRFDGYRDPRTLGQIVDLVQTGHPVESIGHLGDVPIYCHLDWRGCRFNYDRLVQPDYQLRVRPDELYVAPGLVYRAAAASA